MQKNTVTKEPPPKSQDLLAEHLRIAEPSPWVARFAPLVPKDASVLDFAAGGGRHGRHLMRQGCRTVFIDRNTDALQDLMYAPNTMVINADLEDGSDPFGLGGPLEAMTFDAVIVVNYLFRPLMASLINAIALGGVLIYETFSRGNEEFSRPRNPDHLLRSGELLDLVGGRMQVVAYEHGRLDVTDIPGVKQRLCAVKDVEGSTRDDGEPPAHPLTP